MPDAAPLRPRDPARVGQYDILGLLGEGGQGAVYLGRRAGGGSEGDYVAIKLLHDDLIEDASSRARFVRELHVAKRVARFCIAQVLDADLIGDRPYIVSEYVEGPTLYTSVREQGPRSGGALERLAISTLTALAAIHQAGILHRDFKPHNIVLGSDGPRVLDFGIARVRGAASETQTIGTPAYMAPEQIAGQGFGPPADLFAWGSTMVFASRGRPAFGDDDTAAVMHRIVTAEPDLGELAGPMREVVAACLSKDPEDRPTAQEAQRLLMGSGSPAVAADGAGDPVAADRRSAPADAPTGPPRVAAAQPAGPAPVNEAASAAPSAPAPVSVSPSGRGEPPAGAQAPVYAPAQPPTHHTPGHYPPAHVPPYAQTTGAIANGGPPAKRRGRPVLLAAGLSVLALLAAGTAWAVTQGGDGQGRPAGAEAAGAPEGKDAGGSGPTGGQEEGELGTRTKDPAGLTTVSPRAGRSSPQQPRSGRPAQPQPSQQPSGGGGGDEGGDAPSRPNPYTPQQVCNSGGHGSGYYVQRSSAFTGGKVYQLYNSSGYNCVVTMKTSEVGQKTSVWAQLTRKDGAKASDSGSFAYYAGPVFLYAKGQCVKYAGGGGHGSTSAPWGNCG